MYRYEAIYFGVLSPALFSKGGCEHFPGIYFLYAVKRCMLTCLAHMSISTLIKPKLSVYLANCVVVALCNTWIRIVRHCSIIEHFNIVYTIRLQAGSGWSTSERESRSLDGAVKPSRDPWPITWSIKLRDRKSISKILKWPSLRPHH